MVRSNPGLRRRGGSLGAALVAVYGGLLLAGPAVLGRRTLTPGQELAFCGFDCHLHLTATHVARNGGLQVTVRARSDAREVPEDPRYVALSVVDASGTRYAADSMTLDTPLAPGDSYERIVHFDVPASATGLRLVGTWQGWPAYAIPGTRQHLRTAPERHRADRRLGVELMGGRAAPHLLGAGIALGTRVAPSAGHVPGRLDWALGAGLLLLVLAVLHGRGQIHLPDSDRLVLGVPAILLIGAIIWRDSEMLFVVNLLALAGLVALARPVRVGLQEQVLAQRRRRPAAAPAARRPGRRAGRISAARRGARSRFGADAGTRWAAGLGVLAISPVLILFSLLLGSADPVFGQLLENFVDPEFVEQVMPVLFWSWLGAGLLWALTRAPSATEAAPAGGRVSSPHDDRRPGTDRDPFPCLPDAPVPLPLRRAGRGEGNGGPQLRRVRAPRLLRTGDDCGHDAAHPALRRLGGEPAHGSRPTPLPRPALSLLVLLSGLLGSAMLRMSIYTSEYGLTELRLFTTVFMGWLGFVFAWFAATVLRGRRERFTAGALASALVMLLLLNAAGPDGVIVRTNAWRVGQGRSLDAAHLASLGAGAVPAALAVLPALPASERCDVASLLFDRWDGTTTGRGDVWTIERWRATGSCSTAWASRRRPRAAGSGSEPRCVSFSPR